MARSIELQNGSDGWELTDQEYKFLVHREAILQAFIAAGVDSWEGIDRVEWPEEDED
jgi:hypothetical protein